jgi:hypothetical protein
MGEEYFLTRRRWSDGLTWLQEQAPGENSSILAIGRWVSDMGGAKVGIKVGWMRCDDMMAPRAREMAHKAMQGSVGQRYRDTRDVDADAGGLGDVIRDWRLNKSSSAEPRRALESVRRTLTRDWSE